MGWQVGIQSVDLVLFLQTPQSVQRVLEGTLTVGVDAGVAAGSLGRQAGAVTDTSLEAEIFTYARSRGFFAGVTLSSADIIPDEEANAAFYGPARRAAGRHPRRARRRCAVTRRRPEGGAGAGGPQRPVRRITC